MKKLMSVILCVCMLLSLFNIAYAEGDQGLTDAITAVKSVIDIPEEYSEFNYRSYTRNNINVWSLQWSSEKGYSEASVSGDGEILSYYTYRYEDNKGSRWANMTLTEAEEMAWAFVKKVNPALAQQLVFESKSDYAGRVNFAFTETIEGIKLFNRITTVEIDRVNKTVTSYNTYGKTKKAAESAENVISESAALDFYAEKLGAEIVYEKKYDYKEKTITTTPVYKLSDKSYKAISAISGEVILYTYSENNGSDITLGAGASKNEAMLEDAEADMLTPEELAAVETVKGLMSVASADEYIRKEFSLPDDATLSRSGLDKDYYQDKYYINLHYFRAADYALKKDSYSFSAKIDAKTGELLNLNDVNTDKNAGAASEDKIKAAAEAFVSKYAPEDIKLCAPFEVNESGSEEYKTYHFYADRLANGAKVSGEGISLTVDKTGKVIYYNSNITDSLTFESIESAMDERSALLKLSEYADYELVYVYSKDLDKYIPVYEFENKYTTINPMSGEKTGSENSAPVRPEKYNDLSGHWVENIAESLLDNGYFIEGSEFKPDSPVTVKEFLMFAQFMSYNNSEDEIKLMVSKVEPEKLESGEDIDVNQILTRQIAARYFAGDMGYSEIAKHTEIFKYPFSDAAAAEANIGYISICYAKKIFKGDENGNFNPSKSMTRAEAAAAIYNYYSN